MMSVEEAKGLLELVEIPPGWGVCVSLIGPLGSGVVENIEFMKSLRQTHLAHFSQTAQGVEVVVTDARPKAD